MHILRTIRPTPRRIDVLAIGLVFFLAFTLVRRFVMVDSTLTQVSSNSRFVEVNSQFAETERFVVTPATYPVISDADRAAKTVMMATIVKDGESWGSGRDFSLYLHMLSLFEYPRSQITLSLLVSDQKEFENMKKQARESFQTLEDPFHQITIFYAKFKGGVSRADRHSPDVQKHRRRLIARIRNYLLSVALHHEDAVLWIDSDISLIPPSLLRDMVDSDRDIITPICVIGDGQNYDQNAWRGTRIKPTLEQEEEIAKGGLFVPGPLEAKHVDTLARSGKQFERLDSVGGTVLYVKADVHREGAIFPPYYLIGTKWGQLEGYDGIETEGLCYIASAIGYSCWAMPQETVYHA
ncbi:hypothetical protein HKX48_004044 [Thoreauomyces humboldtii]|nr:hypothetical protein HKX48_004044 [Thoreauomyces humboldtii]